MNTSIPLPLCCIIIFLLCSCNRKISSKEPVENNTPVNIITQKDSLKSIQNLCIYGFLKCSRIKNGYYSTKVSDKMRETLTQDCLEYEKYAFVPKPGSDVLTFKYSPWGRCIEELQWPVDSVIKYLGVPYEMIARYDSKDPDILLGTYLFYCDIQDGEIDCTKAKAHYPSGVVFVPKWK